MRMPGIPASPRNSAYSDHSHAASTPTETSVSIVAAPCLRFAQAAVWNGQAPQSTTGVASVERQPLPVRRTGARGPSTAAAPAATAAAETISRRRSGAVGSSASSGSAVRSAAGSVALYPTASTAPNSCVRRRPRPGRSRPSPARSRSSRSRVTPSTLFSLRSIRFAHDAQVMPVDRQLDVLGERVHRDTCW